MNTNRAVHEDCQLVFLPKKVYIRPYSGKHFKTIMGCKLSCAPIHLTILVSFSLRPGGVRSSVSLHGMFFATLPKHHL